MRRLLIGLGVFALALVGAFWWLMLSGTPPGAAPGVLDIAQWRALVEADAGDGPGHVIWREVGEDVAPSWAVEAGRFAEPVAMSYNSMELLWPHASTGEPLQRLIVVGGAIDAETAQAMAQTDKAAFYGGAYDAMLKSMLRAEQVLITHEHLDHVMAIVRHPDPAALAPKLRLNAEQLAAMPQFARGGALAPEIAAIAPVDWSRPTRIAPGVVVAPAAGHTKGSQVIYIRKFDGTEILLVGDIVWNSRNIEALKPRPRLTQLVVFDPNEDRAAIEAQIRALHDLAVAEPDLIIVPAHDRDWLMSLSERGVLEPAAYALH